MYPENFSPRLKVHGLIIFFVVVFSSENTFAQATWYRQSGGTAIHSNMIYISSIDDTSGVVITNYGTYTLGNSKILKSGNTTNIDSSNIIGLNSGILINNNSITTLVNDTIITSGTGANGIFSVGTGANISVSNCIVNTSGAHSRGINATYGGNITMTDVRITTTNDTASAIATDCAGGTINFINGVAIAWGNLSAGVYSTGDITIANSQIISNADHAAVMDANGKITATGSSLTGAQSGVMVHKTPMGSYTATATLTNSKVTGTNGHGIYDTAANLNLTLNGNDTIISSTGNMVYACSNANVNAVLTNEQLAGNIYADPSSIISSALTSNTTIDATITNSSVYIDASSAWSLTGDSHITVLTDTESVDTTMQTVSNISGNGYNVYYKPTLAGNNWLASRTYSLQNGGCLLPEGATCNETNVQRITQPTEIYLYPNPAQDRLFIRSSAISHIRSYSISKSDGKIIISGVFNVSSESIDISEIGPCLYFLTVFSSDGTKIVKFIKQ